MSDINTSSSKTNKQIKNEYNHIQNQLQIGSFKNEDCISISSSNNETRKLKYNLLNKKRNCKNNKKITTMTTIRSITRKGYLNKIMISNFMFLSKTNQNYFRLTKYNKHPILESLLSQMIQNFNMNIYEFAYFSLSIIKINTSFENLELDIDMTAFSIKKLLNKPFCPSDILQLKYLNNINNAFSIWLESQELDFSFCCVSPREVNSIIGLLCVNERINDVSNQKNELKTVNVNQFSV